MGNGFHQIQMSANSQIVFQTHEGLHRMTQLFFGPANSTGIFHHQVAKAFRGVKGCITIHDNVLIYGKDIDEHDRNFLATIQRAAEKGIMFKQDKSTFCTPEVK